MRFLALTLLVAAQSAWAQTPEIPESPLTAVISGPSEVAVGRTIVLDGSASRGITDDTQYRWYRGTSAVPISRSVEAVLTPEEPGTLDIRLEVITEIDEESITVETSKNITVFERKIVLIADSTVDQEKLALHTQTAEQAGVYLRVLQPDATAIPLSADDSLFTLINDQKEALTNAQAIVLWTDGVNGLQSLMRVLEADSQQLEAVQNQAIVVITERSLATVGRTARGPFSVIRPDRIVVTRKEAINPLIEAETVDVFLEQLEQRDIDIFLVDETTTAIRPWNILSSLVNYMLTHGVSSQTVILLLMLPIIATILAFFKQVIGITTFGLYTPSIVALSFLALGWSIGLLFLIFIVTTGYATRAFMRRWRLLYIPKVAIILTTVSLTVLILLAIGAYYNITLSGDTIFVLLIMSTLAESFLTVKTEEGWMNALLGIGETVLAALACVLIVQWSFLQSIILAYPELILLTIVANIGLGLFTGLRLVEYFRFREVFKHLQEE